MFFFFGPLFFVVPVLVLFAASRVLSRLLRHTLHDALPPAHQAPARYADRDGAPTGRLESRVFSLAYRMGGRVTVSDVVMETGLGIRDAEALLDRMTDEVRVRMLVDDSGLVTYEFPEIIDRIERERE